MVEGRAYLTVRVMISAMHELQNEALSDEENTKIFGKCYRLHGHHYYVEATVKGVIDPQTGLLCDRDFLRLTLEQEIVARYSGKNLNSFFPSTTGEDLAKNFFELLVTKLQPLDLVAIRLQETPKNFFTFGPEAPRFL